MLSSRVSAAVGLSAWSQDWAKFFALLDVSYTKLSQAASFVSATALSLASVPLTTGTLPDAIQASTEAASSVAVERNFLATSFSCWLAFEEMERYCPGLPTVSLGSPLPPSTGGKFM